MPDLFSSAVESALVQKVREIDPNAYTPIEALNFLYELVKIARE